MNLDKFLAEYHRSRPEGPTAAEKREQYISWTYGQMQLIGNPSTPEEIGAIYDRLLAEGQIKP